MERSEEVLPRARATLAAERARRARLGIIGELRLTGGSSLPGTLTRGDVDLHLRVASDAFEATVAALRGPYVVVHREIWCATLATFEVPGAPLPTGVAVTPAGSEHDVRFTTTWALLAADPALLDAYTALKQGDPADYEARKSSFFDRLVRP